MRSWRNLTTSLRSSRPNPTKETTGKETPPDPGGRSLRLRLLVWIVLALIPAASVSIVQGVDRVQRDVADVKDRLVQTARASAADEESILASAEQILRSLANQPEVRRASADCGGTLSNTLKGLKYFTNIARISADAEVLCAAAPPPPELANAAARDWWREAEQRKAFFVTPQIYNTTSQRNVLAGVLPLDNDNGRFDGVIVVALDVGWLDVLLLSKVPAGTVAAVFDTEDSMIASNDPEAAAKIFAGGQKVDGAANQLLSASAKGGSWSYAIVPLASNGTSVGFAMRDTDLFASTYLHVATDLFLPVLMLGAASAAIWIATDRLVTRWIVYLKRIATAYGRGHYAIRPVALEEAPSEFRTLGETFSLMAAGVQDRDRRLRDAVAQKSLLIKETHHRVKNNLQVVMSLLSLQAAKMHDAAAQNALRQAQTRVNALALVHRILHEIEDRGAVDLKPLLEDLGHQIQEGFGAERRDLKLDIDVAPRQMLSELAVPLTLFTVEALTNAFKHAYPSNAHGGAIRLTLAPTEDGKLKLAVEDDGQGMEQYSTPGGIGSRLIQAFTMQLGGSASVQRREGGGTVVSLIFPDPGAEDGDQKSEIKIKKATSDF